MSGEDYDKNFDDDDDTEAAAAPSDKLPSASKSGFGETDQLLQNRNSDLGMNQTGGRGKRGVAGRPDSHPKLSKDGKKKLDAYKRANEKLRAELDKCIDSQYKVRELEDQLKSSNEEMRKVSLQNKKLEKMLEKPAGDPNEEDESQVEKIRTLMNDLRLLQDKTRKYKARAQDAERSSQRLTVQLADAQGTTSKQQLQIKQLRKSGMDNKVRKDLEDQLESANKKAESATRELHMCNKKLTGEIKKCHSDAMTVINKGERMRERMERLETELTEVQTEARILSLKLRNERRDLKAKVHKVKPIDDDSRSMAPTDDAPYSHRTVESAVSKAPSVLSKQSSDMSGLEKSVLESIPAGAYRELIRSPTPTTIPLPGLVKDDLSELQNKMEALRRREAKVIEDAALSTATQESLKADAAQRAAQEYAEQLRQRNAESLAPANDVSDAAAAASDAGAAEEEEEEQQGIGSDSDGESEEEEYVDETAQDEDAVEQLSGAASEPQDDGRRGSIQHATDEGEVYYELTDENGDPTGQTTRRSPEESAADGETAEEEVAADVAEEATEEVQAEEATEEIQAEKEVQATEEVQADVAKEATEEVQAQEAEKEVQAIEEVQADVAEESTEEVQAEEAMEEVQATEEVQAEVQAEEEEKLAEEEEGEEDAEDGHSDDELKLASPTKATHDAQAADKAASSMG